MSSKAVVLEVLFLNSTEKAICVSGSGDRKDAVWLPRSQVECDEPEFSSETIITLPEWLALDKGLI